MKALIFLLINITVLSSFGSSELMKSQQELSLTEQIAKVTSKGGVTIKAVKSYQNNKFETLTRNALDAAYARSVELLEMNK